MKTTRGRHILYVLTSLALLIALAGGSWVTVSAKNQVNFIIPTISILSVNPDVSVTVRTANYPANDTFDVYMNYFGTRGVGGIKVDTVATGSGGSFDKTFTIPDGMKGQSLIAIRLESPTSGYFSYNWFYNVSGGGTIPDTGGTIPPGTIPTIDISSVVVDSSVTVRTHNYPANDTFTVRMGLIGTRAISGIVVDTFNSGSGGSFDKTFNIPDELKGEARIAIRLESSASGYYSYNWFYNATAGGTIPDTGGKIPTFSISSVVKDTSVTIQTKDFPANDTFTVTMGDYGTKGIGGVTVTTVNSGAGGTQTMTFNIPDSQKGKSRIAIRLESPTSGYFSFNWFWNNTAP